MKVEEFILPDHLDSARQSLIQFDNHALPAAGCTAFHFYSDQQTKKAVVLTHLDLAGITEDDDEFRIGATTLIADLMTKKAEGWVLDRVATCFASHQIRNISTLGGNIAKPFPWNDYPVALSVLEGSVDVFSDTGRSIDLGEFFEENPARYFDAGDLLLAVNVRKLAPHTGFGYKKQRMRSEAFSLVTTAAVVSVENGTMNGIKVAIGAAVPRQQRLFELEKALVGQKVDEDAIRETISAHTDAVRFLSKEGMSPDYIAQLSRVSLGDSIMQAIAEAQGGNS